MADHYTREGEGRVGSITNEAEARAAHRLASADPELDGLLTGPAHEQKYGLERAEGSAEAWRSVGVHPFKNGALPPGEPGAENVRNRDLADFETAEAPRASKKS